MAKIRVTCPECGHRHTVNYQGVKGQIAGVKSTKLTGNQFEHTITLPGEMVENDQYWSLPQLMIGTSTVGITGGAMLGFACGQALLIIGGVDDPLFPLYGASIGFFVANKWLVSWQRWQWFERIPQAVNTYLHLSDNSRTNEGVTLTVNHKHRDSYTESGRSIALLGVLPVPVEDFAEWGRSALRGDSLAIANWTGVGNRFSRDSYEALLGKMREANIVANLPGKGHKLTNPGRHALKAALDSLPPYPGPRSVHND